MTTPDRTRCPNGSTYKHGCRCEFCTMKVAEWSRVTRRRKSEQSFGVKSPKDLVDITPTVDALTRAHVDHDIPLVEIAEVTGLDRDTVSLILLGKQKRVMRKTEDKILKYYGPDVSHIARHITKGRLIEKHDITWKAKCLLAQGWTWKLLSDILRENGRESGFLRYFPEGGTTALAKNRENFEWLVEYIGDRHGPSNVNKSRMRSRGVYPLIHYTEEGKLIRKSVPGLVPSAKDRVKSSHGAASSRGGNRSAA